MSQLLNQLFACIALFFLGWVQVTGQDRFSYAFSLDSAAVRPLPVNASPATASAEVSLNVFPAFATVTWTVRWRNLSGLPTGAQVRGPAGPGESGPVLFSLGNFFSDSTPASGTYAGFREIRDPAQNQAIPEGRAYLEIRTGLFPDGEIRGQLGAIPEPAPVWLALLGGLMVLIRGRRLTGISCA